jgi:hypothetical protein
MPEQAPHFIRITWIEVGQNAVHVVARCELCNVIADRRVEACDDQNTALTIIGIEALSTRGCSHADAVVATGVRRAFRPAKTA